MTSSAPHDLQRITRELQAARRILANPDRHTTATLERAEAKVRELGPAYFEATRASFLEVSANIHDFVQTFTRSISATLRQMAPTIDRTAALLGIQTTASPMRRRAKLRAARRRARLSTQVPRHRRHRRHRRATKR